MHFSHLKITSYLFNQFSNYDKNYTDLIEKHKHLDLTKKEHAVDLINWLRSWGCRQFKKDETNKSAEIIIDWFNKYKSKLPDIESNLIYRKLDKSKASIIEIFDRLSKLEVSTRSLKSGRTWVSMGPTGAAKTLFAIRPNLFAPWDKKIHTRLNLREDGSGYFNYLCEVKKELIELKNEIYGTTNWDNLFNILVKQHTSYPKLVDEYYWVKITKGCDPSEIVKKIK